jgi:hypothetical protein
MGSVLSIIMRANFSGWGMIMLLAGRERSLKQELKLGSRTDLWFLIEWYMDRRVGRVQLLEKEVPLSCQW